MRKQSIKKRIAFILAVMMTFMSCVPAYADDISAEFSEYSDETIVTDDSLADTPSEEITEDTKEEEGTEETEESTEEIEEGTEEIKEDTEDGSTDKDNKGKDIDEDDAKEDSIDESDVDDDGIDSDSLYESEDYIEAKGVMGSINLMRSNRHDALGSYEDSTVSSNTPFIWWIENDVNLYISINRADYTSLAGIRGIVGASRAESIERIYFDDSAGYDYSFEAEAFRGFTNLTTFIVSKHVTDIKKGVFAECPSLETFVVQDGGKFTSYDGALYSKDYKKLIAVPAADTSNLRIHSDTEEISERAAEGCQISGELFIPQKVETIGERAFHNCNNLTRIYFGTDRTSRLDEANASKCTTIGAYAFANSSATMKRIFLPDTVTSVGDEAFQGNSGLEYLFFYGATEGKNTESILRSEYTKLGIKLSAGSPVYLKYGYVAAVFYPNGGYWGDDPSATGSTVSQISANGGTFKSTYGGLIDPTPGKTGQSFSFWRDSADNSKLTEETELSADADFYAAYSASFTITFSYLDSNGETKEETITVAGGRTIDGSKIPKPVDTDDKKFLYWTSQLYGGTYKTNELSTVNGYGAVYQDDTIIAEYTPVYDVYFYYYNGGTRELLSSCTVPYKGKITDLDDYVNQVEIAEKLEAAYPSSNYTFKGWYRNNGNTRWTSNKRVTDNLNLYAKFERFVTISYYYGDGYSEKYEIDNPTSVTVTYGNEYSLPLVYDYPHFEFGGWYDNSSYSGEFYGGTLRASSDITFYAKWTPKYYVHFYVSNNNTYKEYHTAEVVSGDALYKQIPEDPADTGSGSNTYTFSHWNTEPDGSGTDIDKDTVVNGEITCYAIFAEGHTVKFYSDDELLTRSIVKHGDTIRNFPSVSKLGYVLLSWNTAPDGTGDNIVQRKTKITETINVYAIWYDDPNIPNEPQVTVSFNSMGGTEVASQTLTIYTLLTRPDDPVFEGHKLDGWYTDENYVTEWNFESDIVKNNMYLYAKWSTWTEEDEDNAHGIYWVRMIKGSKVSLASYFTESGLNYSYDKSVVKLSKKARRIKGKSEGTTLITATKVDGSEYEKAVRVFVYKQKLSDIYAYNTTASINAVEYLTVSGFLPERWYSSKPSVASIDPNTGVITVRARGKAKIKAYYHNKPVTATLYCQVPKFAKPFVRLKTGQSKRIRIKKVKKYDIVSWNIVSENSASGNKSGSGGNAEVDDNGRVTALTAGDVTLYATVYGQTISCKVHIEPPVLRKKSIVMNVNKIKRIKLSRTKLKYVEWTSTNDQVAYVDPATGKIYALKSGRVTIKTTAGGVTNTCSVQVQDSSQGTTQKGLSK